MMRGKDECEVATMMTMSAEGIANETNGQFQELVV